MTNIEGKTSYRVILEIPYMISIDKKALAKHRVRLNYNTNQHFLVHIQKLGFGSCYTNSACGVMMSTCREKPQGQPFMIDGKSSHFVMYN